jgi:hypothetical protein
MFLVRTRPLSFNGAIITGSLTPATRPSLSSTPEEHRVIVHNQHLTREAALEANYSARAPDDHQRQMITLEKS